MNPVIGSGNFLVDAQDAVEKEELEFRKCGCCGFEKCRCDEYEEYLKDETL